MTPEIVISIAQQALVTLVLISAPLLLSALGIGLLIGVFQAATQINEMTLSFIPKILGIIAVLFIAGQWMLDMLIQYTHRLISNIPGFLG